MQTTIICKNKAKKIWSTHNAIYIYLFNNISSTECGVPPEGIFNFQFSLRITDCLYYCVVYRKPIHVDHANVHIKMYFNSSIKLTQANQRLKIIKY